MEDNSFVFSSTLYPRTEERRKKAQIPFSFCFSPDSDNQTYVESSLPRCLHCGSFLSGYSKVDPITRQWNCSICGKLADIPITENSIPNSSETKIESPIPFQTLYIIDASCTAKNVCFLEKSLLALEKALGSRATNVAFAVLTKRLSILAPGGKVITFIDLDSAQIPPNCFFKSPIPSLQPLMSVSHDSEGPDVFGAIKVANSSLPYGGRVVIGFTFPPSGDITFKKYSVEAENAALRGVNYDQNVQELQNKLFENKIRTDFIICAANNRLIDTATFYKFSSYLGGLTRFFSPIQFNEYDSIIQNVVDNVTAVCQLKASSNVHILPSVNISPKDPYSFRVPLKSNLVFPFSLNGQSEGIYFQAIVRIHMKDGSFVQRVTNHSINLSDDISQVFIRSNMICIHKYIASSLLCLFFKMDYTMDKMIEPALALLKPIFMSYRYYVSTSPTRMTNLVLPASLKLLPLAVNGLLKSIAFSKGVSLDERSGHIAQIFDASPDMILSYSCPTHYDITSYIKSGEGLETISLSESSFKSDRIIFLDMGLLSWVWIGESIDRVLCKNTFGKPSPVLIDSIEFFDTQESKRLCSLMKGSIRFFVEGKQGETLYRDRLIEDATSCRPSYSEFLTTLHQVTLEQKT